MATQIHPQALVDPKAQLDDGVSVGPYAIIGENVKIKKKTEIGPFAQVIGNTEVGQDCKIFSYAVVGSPSQDLKYKGDKSYLVIGDNNIIREFVTINPGTDKGTKTLIGNNNLFMAYSHTAHNCIVGSNNIFANNATLAGHVEVEDKVVVGGLVAIHQFCRVGTYSIIGGCSKVVQDIPPYSMCDGHPAAVRSINAVGLRRAEFSKEVIDTLKKSFKILFFSDHPLNIAKKLIEKEFKRFHEIDHLIDFISSSKRGIAK